MVVVQAEAVGAVCSCAVCAALSGLTVAEAEAGLATLSPEVRAVLGAQGRLLSGEATESDRRIIRAAGMRCRAGSFLPARR